MAKPCSPSALLMRAREAHESLVASRLNYSVTWTTLIVTTHKPRPQAPRFSVLRKTSSGAIAPIAPWTARAIAGHSARSSRACVFPTPSRKSYRSPASCVLEGPQETGLRTQDAGLGTDGDQVKRFGN